MARKPSIGVLDCGASGGRVCALAVQENHLRLIEIHRFSHSPQRYWQRVEGHGDRVSRLCWNLGQIYEGLLQGLSKVAQRDDLELKSFGVDTWGSDGTWMNATGDVLGLVGTGRDARWTAAREEILQQVGGCELFRLTGTRSEPFCVLNQLYWYTRHAPDLVATAATYMPINSLLHYYLCGEKAAEYTWMSTTQLCAPGEARYHDEVFARLRLPLEKMPPLLQPGTQLGICHTELAESVGLPPFQVIAPATHDTASAYAAAPVEPERKPILISSGTWALVGIRHRTAITSDAAYEAGLTNIAGCEGVYLHAVIMGSWPAQALRHAWSAQDGIELSWECFNRLANSGPPLETVLDIDDPVFYAPRNMESAIVQFCHQTDQAPPQTRPAMARAVYEGLALKTAVACKHMQAIANFSADEIVIVGGGVRNSLTNQWLADATGLPVRTGHPDATALGNGLVQALTMGWIDSLDEGRQLIYEKSQERTFEPRPGCDWGRARQRIEKWRQR